MSPSYITTIGLEVHAQLKTKTKMFCSCVVEYGAEPNTHNCPVCLGYPGALPVINREALYLTVLAGLMLECTIPSICKFDRKNYFYPDMPKNYQISQFDQPLCLGGAVPLHKRAYPKDIQNLFSQSTAAAAADVASALAPSSTLSTLTRCALETPCPPSAAATLKIDSLKTAAAAEKKIALTRIHLEEDVAKSFHLETTTGIDAPGIETKNNRKAH